MGENGKINVLLPGPTSYLGRRLMLKLLESPDVRLRILAVDRRSLGEAAEAVHEIVEGDPLDADVLRRATGGIDVAYFPVRFLGAGPEFDQRRKIFSGLYRDACIQAGVRQIIFLGPINRGGVGNETIDLPPSNRPGRGLCFSGRFEERDHLCKAPFSPLKSRLFARGLQSVRISDL